MSRRIMPVLLAAATICFAAAGSSGIAYPDTAHAYTSAHAQPAVASNLSRDKASLWVVMHKDGRKGHSNAIAGIDADSGKVISNTPLPAGNPASFARDDLGRSWIGYSYDKRRMDNRVNVIFPGGAQKTIITPCMNPERGFVFTAGKAGVVCSNRGLNGSLALFDRKSLSLLNVVSLDAPGGMYLITASAASSGIVVVAGMAKGPDPGKRYCVITLIDASRMSRVWQSAPLESVDVWKILPYGKGFILLNAASAESGGKSGDMLLLGADHSIRKISSLSAPVWGVLFKDIVYAYHNASWNSQSSPSERFLSAYNMKDGTLKKWRLPDRWEATDLAFADGRFYLTKGMEPEKSRQGAYAFNPKDSSLKLIAQLPGACLLITP